MEVPEITLGGKQWKIPKMAVKQNRIIDPLIINLLPVLDQWTKEASNALPKLGTHYDDLLKIVYVAINRAQTVTEKEFEELEITFPELIGAYNTIALQTGIFAKVGVPGEAPKAP